MVNSVGNLFVEHALYNTEIEPFSNSHTSLPTLMNLALTQWCISDRMLDCTTRGSSISGPRWNSFPGFAFLDSSILRCDPESQYRCVLKEMDTRKSFCLLPVKPARLSGKRIVATRVWSTHFTRLREYKEAERMMFGLELPLLWGSSSGKCSWSSSCWRVQGFWPNLSFQRAMANRNPGHEPPLHH